MSNRIIAVGDIHGCSKALDAILGAMQLTSNDTLITLGDYVDRGPDTKGVIDRLIELSTSCKLVPLLGNHEEMMLDVLQEQSPPYRWLQYGGVDTLDSYRFTGDMKVIPEDHREFLAKLVDYYETDENFFVHANYDPDLALDEQPIDLLRWVKLTESIPEPHFSGRRAVVGHTHDRGGEIFSLGHLICLDTYCYGGGWLTAMDMASGQLWQANVEGKLR